MSRNAHPTKSGPGRRHKQGQKHGRALPSPSGGAWLGQRVNPDRHGTGRKARKAARATSNTSLEAA